MIQQHAASGSIVIGVNQELRDFRTNRSKNLDLVLATPGGPLKSHAITLADLAHRWNVRLNANQQEQLARLPALREAPTGIVRVALEAKACMTAHIKALPRLFDELNSSHSTVHANTNDAIAVGYALVNLAASFVSPDLNKHSLDQQSAVVSSHNQPMWTERTVGKLRELPRRSRPSDEGFDAFGIVVIDMRNDGGPVHIVDGPPAPDIHDTFRYDQMVRRFVDMYAAKHRFRTWPGA